MFDKKITVQVLDNSWQQHQYTLPNKKHASKQIQFHWPTRNST